MVRYSGAYTPAIADFTVDNTINNSYGAVSADARMYLQLKIDYERTFGDHHVSAMITGNRSDRKIGNEVAYRYQGMAARASQEQPLGSLSFSWVVTTCQLCPEG